MLKKTRSVKLKLKLVGHKKNMSMELVGDDIIGMLLPTKQHERCFSFAMGLGRMRMCCTDCSRARSTRTEPVGRVRWLLAH